MIQIMFSCDACKNTEYDTKLNQEFYEVFICTECGHEETLELRG